MLPLEFLINCGLQVPLVAIVLALRPAVDGYAWNSAMNMTESSKRPASLHGFAWEAQSFVRQVLVQVCACTYHLMYADAHPSFSMATQQLGLAIQL
jgi:hypothetical protein